MRRCNIPPSTCRHPHTTPCCKDCGDKTCKVRCQNDPELCCCWTDRPPRQKRERKFDGTQMLRLHAQGLSQTQIAQFLGCSRNTVGSALREMGVTRIGES